MNVINGDVTVTIVDRCIVLGYFRLIVHRPECRALRHAILKPCVNFVPTFAKWMILYSTRSGGFKYRCTVTFHVDLHARLKQLDLYLL